LLTDTHHLLGQNLTRPAATLIKKEKELFLIYKDIRMGSVAKSYMRQGFLICEEMRKYLTIYEEAVIVIDDFATDSI
jgi:hypothetical protein